MKKYLTVLKNILVAPRSLSIPRSRKQYGSIVFAGENVEFTLIDNCDQVVYRRRMCHDVDIIVKQLRPFVATTHALVLEPGAIQYKLVRGLIRTGFRVHLLNATMVDRYTNCPLRLGKTGPEALARMLRLSYRHKVGVAGRYRIWWRKKIDLRVLPRMNARRQSAARGS